MKYLPLIIACLFYHTFSCAQSAAFEQKIAASDSINYNDPREKIYIQIDKPNYRAKDTLWLKGYILTAALNTPNDSSKIVYIEIIDATGTVIKRLNPPCQLGLFESYIALSDVDFSQGQYILRSYTRYMRNFGDSLFFNLPFTIIDPDDNAWKASFQQISFDGKRLKMLAKLSVAQAANNNKKPVTVRLRSKNKTLFRTTLIPNATGEIIADTLLADVNRENLVVEITGDDNFKSSAPVVIAAQPGNIDLRFFAEGGRLIAGKQQKLGFKAVGSNGLGIAVNGVIQNSKGTIITQFASIHNGMGIVNFTPESGEKYIAALSDGKKISLPSVEESGIILAVQNSAQEDSVVISIQGSPDKNGNLVYFSATCRGLVVARGKVRIKSTAFDIKLNRKDLPSGIITCTVYDELQQPLNERAFFIWQNDGLQISLQPHKEIYTKKDSVSLFIKVSDKNNQPAIGSFSIAVIDTSQINIQSQDKENLLSYMLLSSDIRGRIEEPYYYFKHPLSDETEALMLTQGWVSYTRSAQPFKYSYEKRFSISGNVTNIFNKPVSNTSITLFGKAGKSNIFFLDTTTNDKGSFSFDQFPLYETDSISMVFRALNRRGKAFNVGITLNEPDYPSYTGNNFTANINTVLNDNAVKQYMAMQDSLILQMKKDGTYLKEVVIKGRSLISGSKNLNKDGGADQVINESMLEKTPKESLLDVLQKQVKGFRVGAPPRSTTFRYMINSNIARFIIDGVDLEFFYNRDAESTSTDYLNYYKGQLSYFSAEDVKAIEIMNTPKYNSSYRTHFLSLAELMSSGPARIDYSFVEITTVSGSGPFMRKTPGIYLYKPVFPFISKEFYSPRYSSPDEPTPYPDFRSTIYWNSNVITNEKGEALLNFYTSENKSSYLMLMQGIDMKGGIGVQYAPLMVQ